MTWLKQSETTSNNGQREESFTSNGYLWCDLEETTGRRDVDYYAERHGADATITVNDMPAISGKDRLEYNGRVWHIDRIRRDYDHWTLIAEAYSYDEPL